jgi:hypothetical protein
MCPALGTGVGMSLMMKLSTEGPNCEMISLRALQTLSELRKYESDRTFNELVAYNIDIQELDGHLFSGGHLPEYTGPVGFIQHGDRLQGFDAPFLALIKRLDLAMKFMDGEESVEHDFVAQILRVLGFERDDTIVRRRKHTKPSDPEAQLIAAAIGAFQENNAKRVNVLPLELLEV